MKTSITARHFSASDSLKNHATESVKKLERFYDRITECDIVLAPTSDENNPQSVELKVHVPNDLLVAKEEASTYEQAVLNAVENMSRQIKRYKEKKSSK